MKNLMARLVGEWLALWWLLKGIAWNACDGLTWGIRGFKAWRIMRPFRKCMVCGGWDQNQVIEGQDGLCVSCVQEHNDAVCAALSNDRSDVLF